MDSVYRELAHAAKSFSRSPVFATVFVLALATGIGALVSVFSVIDSLVLRPLPLPHPEQLVNISGDYRQHSRIPLSYPMFVELERGQKVFTGICGWTSGGEFGVDIDGKTSLSDVRSVTGNYYSVLGATPLLGRLITPVDIEGSTAAPVAVIGYELWRTRFGGDLSVVGRTLRVDGKLFTIIGVTQKWFAGMTIGSPPEITVPAGALLTTEELQSHQLLWLFVTGRLANDNTIEHAAAQLQSFWPRLLQDTVPTESAGARRQSFLSMGLQVDPAATGAMAERNLRARMRRPLGLLFGLVDLILLVICVNLASLTLARAIARRHEISTRVALGASPWQAVRHFLLETLLLSSAAAFLGLFSSYWGSQLLVVLLTRDQTTPALLDVRPDWRVLACVAIIALLTGALTGLIPAWQLARQHPGSALRHNERAVSHRTGRLGKTLIISQVAISLVLLEVAGLFLQSLQSLKSFDPGFDKVAVTEFDLSPLSPGDKGTITDSYRRQLMEELTRLSPVHSVAFSNVPILGADFAGKETVSQVHGSNVATVESVAQMVVTPGFFQTLGIPLITGRDFAWADDKTHPRVAIIDDLLAKRLFPGESPVGKHLSFGVRPDYQDLEIIGISRPARLLDIRDSSGMFIFLSSSQYGNSDGGGTLLIGGASLPALQHAVEQKVESFGREYSTQTSSIAVRSESAMTNERVTATLSSFFAGIALVVAGFGLFGLMIYSIAMRTREIGIRMAMGSQRANIFALILREALQLTLMGVALGIPAAIVASRTFASMLFELSYHDPKTLAAASLTLILAGLIAGLLPALRAMKIEPIAALRYE